ncbi:MAG: MarR family transcriptional regulator [Bacteroidota bacterium]
MGNNIIELLYELKKKFMLMDDVFMDEHNLSQAEYHAFIAISSSDRINSNQLAEHMGLSLSRISRIVDKMVVKGYLLRSTSNKDRRAIHLDLSPEGKKIMEKMLAYRSACELRIISNVSAKELELIKANLGKLKELL